VRKYSRALVLAAAFAALAQAAAVVPVRTADPKTSPKVAVARGLSDAQIERNIRAKLAKSKISTTDHFTVSVQNGVATLDGKTNVIQHKGVATRLAKSGGAIAVQNRIQISEDAKAKAAAKLAKYRLPAGPPARAAVLPAAK